MKTQSHDRLCIFWSSSDPTANDYTEKFFTDFFPTWYRASIKKKWNQSSQHLLPSNNTHPTHSIRMKSIKYASKTTSLPETFHAKKTKKKKTTVTWLHSFCDPKSKASLIFSQMIQSTRMEFRWQRYSDEHEYSTSTSTEGRSFTCSRHEPFFSDYSHTQRYIGHQEIRSH